MQFLTNLVKLNFLTGKKTFIIGGLMVLHGGSQVLLSLLAGHPVSQLDFIEVLNGLGFIGLRKAM